MTRLIRAIRKDTNEVRFFDESMFYRNDFSLKYWIKLDGIRYERILK